MDGGKGGGEQILLVFEKRLTENIRKLNFDKILDPANVKRIVEEADGYQPHLIAPEMGYRRLLQACNTSHPMHVMLLCSNPKFTYAPVYWSPAWYLQQMSLDWGLVVGEGTQYAILQKKGQRP